jgi:phage-related protein
MDGERLAEINRAIAQTIKLAFAASKLSEFFRNASQQISATFGVSKIFEAIRTAAQQITFSSSTVSILEIGRLASLTINVGLTTIVSKIMEVLVSLQLTAKFWGQTTLPPIITSYGVPVILQIFGGLIIFIILMALWRNRS